MEEALPLDIVLIVGAIIGLLALSKGAPEPVDAITNAAPKVWLGNLLLLAGFLTGMLFLGDRLLRLLRHGDDVKHSKRLLSLIAALLLGVIDAFGKQFFPNFASFVIYATMIVVLIARPQGLVRGTA